jgi:hypothetical protein
VCKTTNAFSDEIGVDPKKSPVGSYGATDPRENKDPVFSPFFYCEKLQSGVIYNFFTMLPTRYTMKRSMRLSGAFQGLIPRRYILSRSRLQPDKKCIKLGIKK